MRSVNIWEPAFKDWKNSHYIPGRTYQSTFDKLIVYRNVSEEMITSIVLLIMFCNYWGTIIHCFHIDSIGIIFKFFLDIFVGFDGIILSRYNKNPIEIYIGRKSSFQ